MRTKVAACAEWTGFRVLKESELGIGTMRACDVDDGGVAHVEETLLIESHGRADELPVHNRGG